jgi:hypothetical protein
MLINAPTAGAYAPADVDFLNNLGLVYFHHHQPINALTVWAQAFLMDFSQGERAITHHAGPLRIGGC